MRGQPGAFQHHQEPWEKNGSFLEVSNVKPHGHVFKSNETRSRLLYRCAELDAANGQSSHDSCSCQHHTAALVVTLLSNELCSRYVPCGKSRPCAILKITYLMKYHRSMRLSRSRISCISATNTASRSSTGHVPYLSSQGRDTVSIGGEASSCVQRPVNRSLSGDGQ